MADRNYFCALVIVREGVAIRATARVVDGAVDQRTISFSWAIDGCQLSTARSLTDLVDPGLWMEGAGRLDLRRGLEDELAAAAERAELERASSAERAWADHERDSRELESP